MRYITKGVEKFYKKQEYIDYLTEEDDIELEEIDRYNPSLNHLVRYSDAVYEYRETISKIIDVKKSKYFLVDRKIELSVKF